MSGDENIRLPAARGKRRVLFVCLGNICRSPLAQGVFEHLLTARGVRAEFEVESCGTGGWHIGREPDPRTIAVARVNGLGLASRARQLRAAADGARFDLILGMDRQNVEDIIGAGCPEEKVGLFLAYARAAGKDVPLEVPDPYYGGEDGFHLMHRLITAGGEALLAEMLRSE